MLSQSRTMLVICLAFTLACLVAAAPSVIHERSHVYDVIIIGGGMSGVRAGSVLHDNRVDNFVLLEQRDQLGGRMWAEKLGPFTVEKGANWIEAELPSQSPIWSIAKQINLLGNFTHEIDKYDSLPLLYAPGFNGPLPRNMTVEVIDHLNIVLDCIGDRSCQLQANDLPDESLRATMSICQWPVPDQQTPWQKALEYFVVDWDFEYPPETLSLFDFADNCDSDSALLLESSSGRIRRTRHSIGRHGVRHVRRMQRKFRQSAAVHSDSDNAILLETIDQTADGPPRYFVTDPRGYAAVVRELAKPFERNIRLKTEVIQIDTKRGIVTLSDHSTLRAKNIICTIPHGALLQLQSTSFFTPPLPKRMRSAINRIRMGTYMKIFLQFPHMFWDRSAAFSIWCPSKRGSYSIWQNLETSDHAFFPDNAAVFMVTLVTEEANRVELLSDADVIHEAMSALSQMYPNITVPQPINTYIPRWHSDRFFRGSYSAAKIGVTDDLFNEFKHRIGVMYISGEATDSALNGFVEGAYNAGQRSAWQVLSHLHSQTPSYIHPHHNRRRR